MAPLLDQKDWDAALPIAKRQGLPVHLIATSEMRKQRMGICKLCQTLSSKSFCGDCNCYMPIKTWVATADCPQGKWSVEK